MASKPADTDPMGSVANVEVGENLERPPQAIQNESSAEYQNQMETVDSTEWKSSLLYGKQWAAAMITYEE
jgi:hypothetical protein